MTLVLAVAADSAFGTRKLDHAQLPEPSGIESPGLTLNVEPRGIWLGDEGDGFRHGVIESGISFGVGLGSTELHRKQTHAFALTKVHVGRIFGVGGGESWYRGNWELLGELFGGAQYQPDNAAIVGFTGVVRYNFATGTLWVPFFDVGTGVAFTDIGGPDLSGKLQFNSQAGPGVRWFVHSRTALTLQYRLMHLSNGGRALPNNGVNTSIFYFGGTWIF